MVRGADATDLGARMRGSLKGPLAKTYPVAEAAEAVVRGVERRSRIVACPRWLTALIAIRPLLPRVTELALRRDVAEYDRIAEEEARTRGSDPVGAARRSAPRASRSDAA